MAPLITIHAGQGPLHRRIYESVRTGVLQGRLRPGTRLPSSRALAEQLDISRTPVLQAYSQLWAEGYVTGVTGSGTYISEIAPDRLIETRRRSSARDGPLSARPIRLSATGRLVAQQEWTEVEAGCETAEGISFRVGQVAPDDFPVQPWRRVLGRKLREIDYGYGPADGYRPLREAVTRYLAVARAVECEVDDVFIVAGARRGLDLVTRLLVDAGDLVGIEEPHYPGARRIFEAAGARLLPLPVDDDGLDVGVLDRLPPHVRLVYVTPSHQFPTGGILPVSRRLQLIRWAEATGAVVLEDDYDAEFQFSVRPIEALRSLDRAGRVVYLGTFSKVLSPDLRLGYVVVPSQLREPMRRLIQTMDRQCPVLLQAALAELFLDGQYERHVRRVRRRHAARRIALLESLDEQLGAQVSIQGSAAGVHVLVWIAGMSADRLPELIAEGRRRGVELDSVARTYVGEPPGAGIVLGYGGLSETQIRDGVSRLALAVRAVHAHSR